jgi:hypothetical protein
MSRRAARRSRSVVGVVFMVERSYGEGLAKKVRLAGGFLPTRRGVLHTFSAQEDDMESMDAVAVPRARTVLVVAMVASALSGTTIQAGGPCAVPRGWGDFKQAMHVEGSIASYEVLVFEDSDGALRAVSTSKCDTSKPLFEVVRK